jgi:hypothetical protein
MALNKPNFEAFTSYAISKVCYDLSDEYVNVYYK